MRVPTPRQPCLSPDARTLLGCGPRARARARARARRGFSPQKGRRGDAPFAACAARRPSGNRGIRVRTPFAFVCTIAVSDARMRLRESGIPPESAAGSAGQGATRHPASARAGGVRARCCRRRSGEGQGHRVRPARPARRVAPRWLRRGARQSVGRGWGVSGPGWAQPRRRGARRWRARAAGVDGAPARAPVGVCATRRLYSRGRGRPSAGERRWRRAPHAQGNLRTE